MALQTIAPPEPTADDASESPVRKPAKKTSLAIINFWLDAALFLAIVFVMWVTVMLQMVFPPPTESQGWTLWGLDYNQWHQTQFFALCLSALLAVEHLVLHWNWVCTIMATRILRLKNRPDEGIQAVLGVGTFISVALVILGSILVATFMVKKPLI